MQRESPPSFATHFASPMNMPSLSSRASFSNTTQRPIRSGFTCRAFLAWRCRSSRSSTALYPLNRLLAQRQHRALADSRARVPQASLHWRRRQARPSPETERAKRQSAADDQQQTEASQERRITAGMGTPVVNMPNKAAIDVIPHAASTGGTSIDGPAPSARVYLGRFCGRCQPWINA